MKCYMNAENGILCFGNRYFERWIRISGSVPMHLQMTDKTTGKIWKGRHPISLFRIGEETNYVCRIHSYRRSNGMRVVLQCIGSSNCVEVSFLLFDDSPFFSSRLYVAGDMVCGLSEEERMADGNENAVILKQFDEDIMSEPDCIEGFGISDRHLQVSVTALRDVTDRYNNLVQHTEEWLYSFGRQTFCGDMFQLTEPMSRTGLTIVKEAPCLGARLNSRGADVICYPGECFCVRGSGLDDSVSNENGDFCYGTAIGFCTGEQALTEYKKFYQAVCSADTYIMSNTWGDRNQDAAVCDAFIRREIDCAAFLGVDVVQIDDGWQKGTTANSKLAKSNVWGSYYDAMPDFWDVNSEKFPEGLEPVCEYAKEKGVKIGLWFSPDATDSYSHWETDAEELILLYRSYGISYFKLDGIDLKDKKSDRNLRRMVEMVKRETENTVDFNFDITAQVRWGYFYQKHYGKLFLENRYTDWGNYFPHDTLRNLWEVSRYVPAQRLQIEVLNPRRNRDKYQDDPFAPDGYSMDYLFGIAMVANPLLWMEMSHLELNDRETLKEVIACYRRYRSQLQKAVIVPVGEKPSGISITGFAAELEQEGFLLLFRENTDKDGFLFSSAVCAERLYGDGTVEASEKGVCVHFKNRRSFILLHYQQ